MAIKFNKVVALARTMHIYLTMFAFLMMIFFALTGLILNHEDWFGGSPVTTTRQGTVPVALLKAPDKLMVVEELRSHLGAVGAVSAFDTDDKSLRVALSGPGRHTEAEIDRVTGATTVTIERRGFLVRMDDLHRGKDSGKAWSLVIDISAILLLLGSLTGVIMWIALPRRRKWGLVALGGSLVVCFLIYLLVP